MAECDFLLKGLVFISIYLQAVLYFLTPLKRTSFNRWVSHLISATNRLSIFLPNFSLLLVCARVIYIHAYALNPNPLMLLKYAALLLVVNAVHPQESKIPSSLYQNLLKFAFYDLFCFGIICHFASYRENPAIPIFNLSLVVILACTITFSKLNHLWHLSMEVNQLVTPQHGEIDVTQSDDRIIALTLFRFSQKLFWVSELSTQERESCSRLFSTLDNARSFKVIQLQLDLIYKRFCRGEASLMLELLVLVLLPVRLDHFTSWSSYIPLFFGSYNQGTVLFVHSSLPVVALFMCAGIMLDVIPLSDSLGVSFYGIGLIYALEIVNFLMKKLQYRRTTSQFNLLSYGLIRKQQRNVFGALIGNWLQKQLVPKIEQPLIDNLGGFIIERLHRLHDSFDKENIASSKGQCFLQHNSHVYHLVNHEASFKDTVLQWHLATTILYHSCDIESNCRDKSMTLSDYMGHLLLSQSGQDALSEIVRVIRSSGIPPQETRTKEICGYMVSNYKSWAENESNPLVYGACDLAEKMRIAISDEDTMWETVAVVWVEMLAYDCIQSDPIEHVRGLSRGARLADVVWLCMVNLGWDLIRSRKVDNVS